MVWIVILVVFETKLVAFEDGHWLHYGSSLILKA